MNDKGVCRTAPATPGLLKMLPKLAFIHLSCYQTQMKGTGWVWWPNLALNFWKYENTLTNSTYQSWIIKLLDGHFLGFVVFWAHSEQVSLLVSWLIYMVSIDIVRTKSLITFILYRPGFDDWSFMLSSLFLPLLDWLLVIYFASRLILAPLTEVSNSYFSSFLLRFSFSLLIFLPRTLITFFF